MLECRQWCVHLHIVYTMNIYRIHYSPSYIQYNISLVPLLSPFFICSAIAYSVHIFSRFLFSSFSCRRSVWKSILFWFSFCLFRRIVVCVHWNSNGKMPLHVDTFTKIFDIVFMLSTLFQIRFVVKIVLFFHLLLYFFHRVCCCAR